MRHSLWGRALGALVPLAAALALTACGSSSSSSTGASTAGTATSSPAAAAASPGAGKPAVVIGDKNFTEENILGSLYAQALKAKGFTVTQKDNIGSSEITYKALTSGQIDMYPEYTGTLLTAVANQTKQPASAAAAYTAAKAFAQQHGYTLLAATPFSDSDAVAVLPAYASSHSLKTVADLAKLGKSLKLAAAPEFATRYQGLVGLKQVYGVNPTFVPLAIGLDYNALDSGQVQAADVFTTDGQLQSGKYVLLSDPKGVFGYQNVAPVVSTKTIAAEGPAFVATLNHVSALLTLAAIQKMNAAVTNDKLAPSAVAATFLKANGLS
jgi:osmoprotectant transport system substrate-binding protein